MKVGPNSVFVLRNLRNGKKLYHITFSNSLILLKLYKNKNSPRISQPNGVTLNSAFMKNNFLERHDARNVAEPSTFETRYKRTSFMLELQVCKSSTLQIDANRTHTSHFDAVRRIENFNRVSISHIITRISLQS